MNTLYLKICEQVEKKQDLFAKYKVPGIKYIDLYRGQPLAPERFELYDIPALFLEYSIDWKTNILTLSVHVVTDITHSTANISPNKLTGLEIFTLYNVIKEILKNLSSENTGKLELLGERPAEADIVNYQILDFTCSIEDIPMEERYKEGIIEELHNKQRLSYSID